MAEVRAPLPAPSPDAPAPVADTTARTMAMGQSDVQESDLAASGNAALAMFGDVDGAGGDDVSSSVPRADSAPVNPGQDMRMIRTGLGLSAEATRLPPEAEAKAVEAAKAAVAAAEITGTGSGTGVKSRKRYKKSAARRKAAKGKRGRRSRLSVAIYALLGLAVITGAVFAGFKVRELRLDQQIRFALGEGTERASNDTFVGLRRALESYESILKVKRTKEALAARARVSAQLASEFGDDLSRAEEHVSAAANSDELDAAIAQVHLLLARGKLDEAQKLVGESSAKFVRAKGEQAYLEGLIGLHRADYKSAASDFEQSITLRRPLTYVHLAQAQLHLGAIDPALAAVDSALELTVGHPSALIVRARALVAGRRAIGSSSSADMRALIAEGARGLAQQELGVSKAQLGWAALALSELELNVGNREAAEEALNKAASNRNPADLGFTSALTSQLIALAKLERAAEEVKRAAKEFPGRRLTRVMQARLSLAEGKPAKALAAIDAAGELRDYPAALALRGRARLELGDVAKAVEDFDAALKTYELLPSAVLGRARADIARGRGREAVRRLEALFDDVEEAEEAVAVAYAEALEQSGDRDRARAVLQDLAKSSASAAVWVSLAGLERRAGQPKEATKALEKVRENEPNNIAAVTALATIAVDAARYSDAATLLDSVKGSAAAHVTIVAHRARVAILQGDHTKAAKLIEDAQKTGGAVALVIRESGRLALRRGDSDSAIKRLQQAVELAPADVEGRLLLLQASIKAATAGRAAKPSAEDIVAGIEKDFAGTPEVNFARGLALLAEKKSEQALIALAAARSRMGELRRPARERALVQYYIGRAHYIGGNLKKARAAFAAALKRDSKHADTHYFLGQIEFESDNFEAAVAAYKKSVDADPSGNPRAWFYLADVSHVLGRDVDAKKALNKYIERFPNGSDIEAVKRLLSKL